jgi:hypothetical protein
MQTLYAARQDILNGIETGTISRGDLYSPIDRLRILADVAPYSDEYREMQATSAILFTTLPLSVT